MFNQRSAARWYAIEYIVIEPWPAGVAAPTFLCMCLCVRLSLINWMTPSEFTLGKRYASNARERIYAQYSYHPPFPLQHAALPACHTKQWQLSHLTFTIKIVIIIWHTHTYIHIHSRICTQLLIHIQHDFPAVHNRFRRHCRAHHRHHRHHHQQQHHFHDYYDDQRQQRIVISW